MASSEEYLNYVLDMLQNVEGLSHRKMMSEYLIYLDNKVIGGIYDDEFLLKSNNHLDALVPDARRRLPYEGAKSLMIIVDFEDPETIRKLVEAARF